MEHDDEPEPYRSPSDQERIWLHPSELGSLLPPAPIHPVTGARRPAPARSAGPRSLAVPVLSGMIGAALSMGMLVMVGGLERSGPERIVERVAAAPMFDLEEPEEVARLASAVAPAIVALRATTPSGERFGSGVVFRSDGHVLTNEHLVEKATSIELTGVDGRSWEARHAGSDPESDLALLLVPDARLEPAVLGSARNLRVGQMAVVVGAPTGSQGSPTVTAGVIAGLGEVIEAGDRAFYDVITTDAMIGHRASGGPLVDRSGAVVGITSRTVGGTPGEEGLGLAIPIDLARRVAEQLISNGRMTYPWLGVSGTDLDPWTAKEYGATKGTLVRQVSPKSPAERGGVKVQDVVTAVQQSPIASMNELTMLVRRHEPGDHIKVTVLRSGVKRTLTVRLQESPGGH